MDLQITMCQVSTIWESIEENLARLGEMIRDHPSKSDLFILPETFTTGFTMATENYGESMNGQTVSWMRKIASETGTTIIGSMIAKQDESIYNRLIVMPEDGFYQYYDKRHLFRMSGENNSYQAGTKKLIYQYGEWRICPMICYDLRFPVWSRNRNDYDLLIYVSNWPEARKQVWMTLLQARAIENHCYVIGVNRTGRDGMGITYCGDSMLIDFKGQVLHHMNQDREMIHTTALNHQALLDFRKKFPVHLDSDDFEISI